MNENVEMITQAYAEKLLTDESGKKIIAVVVEIEGEEIVFTADIFIVACGAVNSAALMLRSTNERHPAGLANSSGQLRRVLSPIHHVSPSQRNGVPSACSKCR